MSLLTPEQLRDDAGARPANYVSHDGRGVRCRVQRCGYQHAQGVVANWLSKGDLEALRARFPRTSRIRKPVDTDTLDRNPRGALYHLKPDRCRLVSYVVPAVEGGRNVYRDTKRRSLRRARKVVASK